MAAPPPKGQSDGAAAGARPKKETVLELSKYLDKVVRVKFQGGREVTGLLKGYDPVVNLVLDNAVEYLRDPDDAYVLTGATRPLGLTVCRGTCVTTIIPVDGLEEIANPFVDTAAQ